jgi:hypothetical protein
MAGAGVYYREGSISIRIGISIRVSIGVRVGIGASPSKDAFGPS